MGDSKSKHDPVQICDLRATKSNLKQSFAHIETSEDISFLEEWNENRHLYRGGNEKVKMIPKTAVSPVDTHF